MKLRNKLVAVLAASMVVTSVPVVTMADTTNNMSTSRYAQKDSTFGYLNGKFGGYDIVYGGTFGIGNSYTSEGYDYRYSNGFEFTPVFTYNTTDTTFMSLTSDTEFNTRAIVAYVDAFNGPGNTTNLQFDADGKVVGAYNPDYNGKTADDILKSGVFMYFNPATNGNVAQSMGVYNAWKATVTYTGTTTAFLNQVKAITAARMKAAGSTLYTAALTDETLMNEIANTLAVKIAALFGVTITTDAAGKIVDAPITITGNQVQAVTKDTPAIAAMIKDVTNLVSAKQAGKEVTTTYSQLFKASNSIRGISTNTVADDIPVAAANEIGSWVLKNSTGTGYSAYLENQYTATNAKMKIQKVDLINWKDANDREYKSHLRIDSEGTFTKGASYRIPVLAKLGGDKVALLNVNGKDSNITSGTYSLTQDALTDKRLSVAADSKTLRTNYTDEIGEIRFTESQIKALTSADNRRIKIELPKSTDLEFNLTKTAASAKVTGKRGFFAINTDDDAVLEGATDSATSDATVLTAKTASKTTIKVAYGETSRRNNYSDKDTQTLIVELPAWADNTAVGELVLSGIYVQPMDDTAAVGEVKATISEYLGTNETSSKLLESTTVKVAEVKEYDISLKCDKPVDVKAGRSGIVNEKKTTFILEEAVKDSLVDGRKIKFIVENGYIFGPADIDDSNAAATGNAYNTTGLYGSVAYKKAAEDKFNVLIKNEKIKFEEKAGDDGATKGVDLSTLSLEMDAEGRVIGFSAVYPRLKDSEADKIKVTMPIAADVMATGEVKVKAENLYTRSFQDKKEDPSCVIANVIKPIDVTFDGAKLKVGKQAQEAGTITIKETDKGMIENGWLFLAADNQTGITFDAVPEVKVEGTDGKTLAVKNVALSKDKAILGIEVYKESSEASTIKISSINLTADRTVPEANYDLAIWGQALTDENELGITNFTQNALYNNKYFNQTSDLYTVKDFVQMTTVNTEDLSNSAKAATAAFKIGENKFTVNGETVSMDNATAYIKDNLTFVPVRYVAQAFGIAGNAVQFDGASGTVTIVAGDKVINMTNGKAYITVNGTNIPMQTKAEIKDGRMCVPMAYIANALGVEKSWDAATKTATFTNQRSK